MVVFTKSGPAAYTPSGMATAATMIAVMIPFFTGALWVAGHKIILSRSRPDHVQFLDRVGHGGKPRTVLLNQGKDFVDNNRVKVFVLHIKRN